MIRHLLACAAVVSCSSGAPAPGAPAPTTGPKPVPRDGRLHTTETPEPGGTHLQITGLAVPLQELELPEWIMVPISGAVDISVDLHIPSEEGYRGATGEATLRCPSGCVINDAPPAADAGSASVLPPFPRITIDRLEARAVFARGRAELTMWTVESKDVRIEVRAGIALARELLESEVTGCVRFASKASTLASNSRLASIMADAGLALDVNGLWNIKLAGRPDALAPVEFGCDGATRPSRPPPDPVEGIKELGGSRYELSRAYVDQLLSDPMTVVKGARIVPAMKNGKPEGFKLYAIRPESLFGRLGFANGDTVLSINGLPMDSAEKGLEIYTKLRDASALEVKLVRKDKPLTFHYVIK